MLKQTFILLSILISVASVSEAASTISFTGTNTRAIGFLNQTGAASVMKWGLLINTSGDGVFNVGNYGSFNFSTTGALGTAVNLIGGGSSGEVYYSGTTPPNTIVNVSANGTDPGGAGGIGSIANVPTFSELGLGASVKFGIIWFDETTTPGSPTYGFYTHSSFDLPAAGPSNSFLTPFLNNGVGDTAKLANNSFSAIPEPSRMMLLGLGLFGLFFRRRR